MSGKGTPDFHEIRADIRQKVVAEPAYGCAVTEKQTPEPAAPECGKLETLYDVQVNIGDDD